MSTRAFITRLALFALGALLIFAACSLHYDWLNRDDNLTRQMKLFAAADPSVLILGDSHAAMDLDMQTFGPSYASLAYPQENWREILLKARRALDAKPGVRTIVIPVDGHMFANYRNDQDMTHSMRLTRSYGELARLYGGGRLFPVRYGKSLLATYVPLCLGANWSGYRVMVLDEIQNLVGHRPPRRIDIDAFGSIHYSDAQSFADFPVATRMVAARARADEMLHPPVACEPLVRAFDEFLDLCSERHVAVVGVRYPLSPELQSAMTSHDLGPVNATYATRRAKLEAVLDYTHVFDGMPRLFRDEDHLTREGSRTFTRMLSRDLQSIGSHKAGNTREPAPRT